MGRSDEGTIEHVERDLEMARKIRAFYGELADAPGIAQAATMEYARMLIATTFAERMGRQDPPQESK